MKKTILVVGIMVLFIGISAFTGATNIETKTGEPQENVTTDEYRFATIELIEGELEVVGFGWFGIPLPPFHDKEIVRSFLITSHTSITVLSGELKVKPIVGDEITLYPDDEIEMKISFEFLTQNLTTHRCIQFKARAIGVTITRNIE